MFDQLPDPSTWMPLKLNSNHSSSSVWTSVYRAEIKHEHTELHSKLLDIPHSSSPITTTPSLSQNSSTCVVIKQVSPHLYRPPHDTATEIKILSSLDHPNIVPLLAHLEPPNYPSYCIFMPLYPTTLCNILNDETNYLSPSKCTGFDILMTRITRDIGSGLSFLHSQSIAHRDINPSNIALTHQAHAVLIDFGTAWPGHPSPQSNTLEFELGTMPYRAPELLFGSQSYSPFAIDIWSYGALIAEFFTPMVPLNPEESSNPFEPATTPPISKTYGESNSGNALDWYCSPSLPTSDTTGTNRAPIVPLIRKTLFEGSSGDIGLVGSIFKILGTPDCTTWPEAPSLPDFSKLNFHIFEKQKLENLLPYLDHNVRLLEEELNKKLGKKSDGIQEEDQDIADLENQIKLENIRKNEKINLIESFLKFSSSVRIESFNKIFGNQNLKNNHENKHSIHHVNSSWLFKSVKDEDEICFSFMKLFLEN